MRPKGHIAVRRPIAPSNLARTRAQLAAEMTRLEFDRERLVRDFTMLSDKLTATRMAFDRVSKRIIEIQHNLDLTDATAPKKRQSRRV